MEGGRDEGGREGGREGGNPSLSLYVYVCVCVCVCVYRSLLAYIRHVEVHGLHVACDRERAQRGAVVRDDLCVCMN
jgi:hypothetical protein